MYLARKREECVEKCVHFVLAVYAALYHNWVACYADLCLTRIKLTPVSITFGSYFIFVVLNLKARLLAQVWKNKYVSSITLSWILCEFYSF